MITTGAPTDMAIFLAMSFMIGLLALLPKKYAATTFLSMFQDRGGLLLEFEKKAFLPDFGGN
jgi:hypothetical protein